MKATTTIKPFVSYVSLAGVLLCSTLLFFSCSKNNGADPQKDKLVLTASATEIDKGENVTFEVTANGKAIEADIYIENTKINGTTHTFEEAGTYQIVAKKSGYADSEVIDLKIYQVDVHVAGFEHNGSKYIATYWKNGKPVTLSDGSRPVIVESIFVTRSLGTNNKKIYLS